LREHRKQSLHGRKHSGFHACATPELRLFSYNSFEGFVVYFGEHEGGVDGETNAREQSNEGAAVSEATMNTSSPIRILTVDDHPVLREGIAAVLGSETDMVIVAEASNGREAVEHFRTHRPDITLMDLQMPIMNGTDAIVAIRKEFPDARIIVLTTYSGDVLADRALKAGAYGYLLKSMLRKELTETIRIVHGGKRRVPPEIAVEMAEHHTDDDLTEREIEVLRQVAAGNANKIVADHLTISEETVKAHLRSIFSKLGANDRTHAVTIALKRGIIDI
jgi:DNA-binding NarL/FixJ family response regulator